MDEKDVASAVIKRIGNSPKLIRDALDRIDVNFRRCFCAYANATFADLSQIKTLASGNTPVSIFDVYVETAFDSDNVKVSESDFFLRMAAGERSLIIGSAGAGKSVFMKNAFCRLAKNIVDRIPIYFELRKLNSIDQFKLMDELFSSIHRRNQHFTREQFDYALKGGLFIILLDGLDEVAESIEQKLVAQVHEIAERFPHVPIVVSSRPADFRSWPTFSEYKIRPISKSDLVKMIGKISNYEDEKRAAFIKKIDDGLYRSHAQFLSNPLIATMTFITFSRGNSIPTEIHAFYESAFEALASLHDGTKTGFSREFSSGLSTSTLKSLLAVFSTFAFQEAKFTMPKAKALEYTEDALTHLQIEANQVKVLRDWQRAIGLLIEDGLELTFIHRSFQEYFVAYCIFSMYPDNAREMIVNLMGNHSSNHIFRVLESINFRLAAKIYGDILGDCLKMLSGRRGKLADLTIFHRFASRLVASKSIDPFEPSASKKAVSEKTKYRVTVSLNPNADPLLTTVVRGLAYNFDKAPRTLFEQLDVNSFGFSHDRKLDGPMDDVEKAFAKAYAAEVYSNMEELRTRYLKFATEGAVEESRSILSRPKRQPK